ncbi:MAG: hypothetical protein WBO10_07855 [Pyrinomonadaceae bacterium]
MKFIGKAVFAVVAALLLSGLIVAQKTWEKPYQKWSKDDALNIVSSSPWAATYQSIAGSSAAAQSQIARNQSDTVNSGGGGRNAGSFDRSAGPAPVVIRLHSGRPIREAITRGRQLAVGYDKMNDQQKKDFDESGKGFLDCAICKDYYVVSVTKLPDSTSQSIDEGIFERLKLEDLKGNVWLITDGGQEREIFQFTAPKKAGESAYLFFARKDANGKDLITKDVKDFKVVFNNAFYSGSNPYAVFIPRSTEFKVSKIMIGSELAF